MRVGFIAQFLKLESASGIILFAMALTAFILCNSPWGELYQNFWQTPLILRIDHHQLTEPLLFWINEGLMTLFFLIVGVELKQEFLMGALGSLQQVILPAIAALGGMIIPAFIYCLFNYQHESLHGWAIPVATDIAFALGVLSLFGSRISTNLKLFLLALAIFDDIGAILIIALFYSKKISFFYLMLSGLVTTLLFILNRLGYRNLSLYIFIGLLLWVCVLKSGIHATLAGVVLAFMIPFDVNEKNSPLQKLQKYLHPWVAFFIMPLFALANAGLSLKGLSTAILFDRVALGIIAGLFLGKQVGVFLFSWLAIRFGWAKLPKNTSWGQLYAVAILCGIGFTMSLFLGNLAFDGSNAIYLREVRLGVLMGSFLSGAVGALVLSGFVRSRSLKEVSL